MLFGKPFENLRKDFEHLVTTPSSISKKISRDEQNILPSPPHSLWTPIIVEYPTTDFEVAGNKEDRDAKIQEHEVNFTTDTATVDTDHLHSKISSLSRNIGSQVLNSWDLYWEPQLDEGKVRIRWTCRCGMKLWDDFKELRPGAAEELRRSLESYSYIDRMHRSANEARLSTASQPELIECLARHEQGLSNDVGPPETLYTIEDGDIGLASLAHITMSPSQSSRSRQRGSASPIDKPADTGLSRRISRNCVGKFLLLCSCKRNDTLRLLQLPIEHITNDFRLFQELRVAYAARRGTLTRWFSPRRLISISFRKVGVVMAPKVHRKS